MTTAKPDTETAQPDINKFVAILATVWPGTSAYPPSARFRVPNRDRLGYPIPDAYRGRTGTVIAVDGPVMLGGDIAHRKTTFEMRTAIGLSDVARQLGVNVEMLHIVRYDDSPDVSERLSDTWMEPEA